MLAQPISPAPARDDQAVMSARASRDQRAESLFRSLEQAGDAERRGIRQQIVVEYLDVAEAVAHRYSSRVEDWNDIRQVACVGLVKAVCRFDVDRGDFVSFAVPTIAGEIKRHLRDNSWFVRPPRRLQELHTVLVSEVPRMAQQLGRSPSPRDIAEDLGESVDIICEAVSCFHGMRPMSLDATARDEGSTLADTLGADDVNLAQAELSVTLRAACATLTARERHILYLRFNREQTQTQIAGELGITQMQVSRLLTRILATLRERLSPELLAA
jgi:RNA polymerase sigma-B factor